MLLSAVLAQVLIISSPDYWNCLIISLSFPPASVAFVKCQYDDVSFQLKTGLWLPILLKGKKKSGFIIMVQMVLVIPLPTDMYNGKSGVKTWYVIPSKQSSETGFY